MTTAYPPDASEQYLSRALSSLKEQRDALDKAVKETEAALLAETAEAKAKSPVGKCFYEAPTDTGDPARYWRFVKSLSDGGVLAQLIELGPDSREASDNVVVEGADNMQYLLDGGWLTPIDFRVFREAYCAAIGRIAATLVAHPF